MNTILITLGVSFAIAFLLGLLLGVFKKIFAVPVNEKAAAIRACLPGANCGGCGFAGCDGYAAAVAAGKAEPTICSAGGPSVAEAVGKLLGLSVSAEKKAAVLCCRGTKDCAKPRGQYKGIESCAAAVQAINGTKLCSFGCAGFGDCVEVCKFGALAIGEDGLPHVDREKCTGCGACAKACPKHLFRIMSVNVKGPVALCQNRSDNKPSIMKNCKNGCIKCGKCEKVCSVAALKLVKGIPEIDYALCANCGECVKGCPTKVLGYVS